LKTTLVLGLLVLLPALGDAAQSPPTPSRIALQKTVVVSLQRVVNESIEGRAVGQRMQVLLQKMTTDLAGKQKEPDFQRLAQQSQTEYTNAQRQAQLDLRAKMNPVIAAIAAERGVEVVLNADTLVWSAPKLDVTSEVIAKMDAASTAVPPAK
jgi:Skp family chaperone for outer membrane proteins